VLVGGTRRGSAGAGRIGGPTGIFGERAGVNF